MIRLSSPCNINHIERVTRHPPRASSALVASRAMRAIAASPARPRARPSAASVVKHRSSGIVRAGKSTRGLFDDVLDMLEGGKKLRRWYGSDSSVGARGSRANDDADDADDDPSVNDAAPEDEDEDVELDVPRAAILVTNASGTLGESVCARLILAKANVVAEVGERERASAEGRFGPYARLASDAWSVGARLNGVRAVVACGALDSGFVDACVRRKVKHIVLVSSAKSASNGLFASAEEKARWDRGREAECAASGLAVTVIRPTRVKEAPGGSKEIVFAQGDTASGEITVEDLAETCARALTKPPRAGTALTFEVSNGSEARSERDDWNALFNSVKA